MKPEPPDSPVDPQSEEGTPKVQPAPPSEYVRAFQRLFRSFRQQVFVHTGQNYETVIAKAEATSRILSPEFDCHKLNEETAPVILDLIQEIVHSGPLLKRSKLRQAALTLIADLYGKQYNLLDEHGVIDKVEQTYYRLKK